MTTLRELCGTGDYESVRVMRDAYISRIKEKHKHIDNGTATVEADSHLLAIAVMADRETKFGVEQIALDIRASPDGDISEFYAQATGFRRRQV